MSKNDEDVSSSDDYKDPYPDLEFEEAKKLERKNSSHLNNHDFSD